MRVNFNVVGGPRLAQKLQSLTGLARKIMIPVVAKYALKIQSQARRTVAVDMGDTRRSIITRFVGDGLTAAVGSDAKSARWVEEGTGPAAGHDRYFPPPDALLPWMSRHGITPKPGQTDMDVAWSIARAIYRKGIKGRPFLEPAFQDVAPDFVAAANKELAAGLLDLSKEA